MPAGAVWYRMGPQRERAIFPTFTAWRTKSLILSDVGAGYEALQWSDPRDLHLVDLYVEPVVRHDTATKFWPFEEYLYPAYSKAICRLTM
jgi:hypothetical protein